MSSVETKNIRNVAIVGHGHTGKTSFVSAVLFDSGVVNRLGKVDQGNTVTDFDPEEIERKITISSSLCFCEWKGHKFNILDTPGYGNFIMDTKACLRGVDSAVLLVCGVSGVEVQTEKIWEILEEFGLPRIFIINKLDRENSDFERALSSLKEAFGRNCVPIQLPIGKESQFTGVIDLVKMKAYIFQKDESGSFKESNIPSDMVEIAKKNREELMEMVAENDETLMSSFFEKGELEENELREGLRKAVHSRLIYPVLSASSLLNIGIQPILDAFIDYLPSPLERNFVEALQNGKKVEVTSSLDQPFSAFVFKTISDPYAGRISIFRVFSGKVSPDSTILNSSKGTTEKLGGIFYLQGKQQIPAPIAQAGDILATARLKDTLTGDTLTAKDFQLVFEPLKFPQSSISFAIEPKTRQDEEKISTALQRIAEEDPTIKFERDLQTKELLISGNGQLHVEIIVSRLKKRYNVDVILRKPKIPYKETIKGTSDVQGKYKKQTGGRGQYGDVKIKMEPLPRGADFEFVDQIFGGAIPKNYIPSVEKGIQEARQRGVLAGYPAVDFRVILYDGSYHEVDSSDLAFKIAASMAFKKGMSAANPTLLEPIMNVEIYTPDTYLGDIMGNLNGRRGRIVGVEERGGKSVIKAQVPMAEMLDFEPSLTSITGGRGSYSMDFSHYEEVPTHLQQKIIAQAKEEGKIPSEVEE